MDEGIRGWRRSRQMAGAVKIAEIAAGGRGQYGRGKRGGWAGTVWVMKIAGECGGGRGRELELFRCELACRGLSWLGGFSGGDGGF